jgi:ferric-dicitrate binding protein FerR (iron transport regulator)
MEREEFIKKWLEGKISSDDLDKKMRDGGEGREMRELKDIISRSTELRVPQKRTKTEAGKQFTEKIDEQQPLQKVVKMKPWVPLGIAASLILLVVSCFVLFRPESVEAPMGKQVAHVLPDGSQVWLNADSRISFRQFELEGTRKIKLEGEAFFEVQKGGPFIVEGENGTITVRGTNFNVNQRNSSLEVACFSGSAEVTSKDGQRITLNTGEFTASKNETLIQAGIFDEEKTASWRMGKFYFEGVPLENVINELERQFDIEIRYNGKEGRVYTGYFSNKDLDEALQLVFLPLRLPFKKEGRTVVVE